MFFLIISVIGRHAVDFRRAVKFLCQDALSDYRMGSEYFDQPRFETVVRHGVVGDDGAVGLVAWALSRV